MARKRYQCGNVENNIYACLERSKWAVELLIHIDTYSACVQ